MLPPLTIRTTVFPLNKDCLSSKPAGARAAAPSIIFSPMLVDPGHGASDPVFAYENDGIHEFAAEVEGEGPGLDAAGHAVRDRLLFLDRDDSARLEGGRHEG